MLIRRYKGNWLFCVDTFIVHRTFSVESLGLNSVGLIELNNLSLNNTYLSLESIRSWVLYVQAELEIQYLRRFGNVVLYHCSSRGVESPHTWCLRFLAATAKILHKCHNSHHLRDNMPLWEPFIGSLCREYLNIHNETKKATINLQQANAISALMC